MSQAALFKRLGAPLKNPRWSWGAVRVDGSVILRVWQDQEKLHGGARYMHISFGDGQEEDPENYGRKERLQHVELICGGAKSYMVMCQADNTSIGPRTIKNFNRNEVFPGGRLLQDGNDLWLERLARIPVSAIIVRPAIKADR